MLIKIALGFLLLIAVYLGGFLPERSKANKLEEELKEARRQTTQSQLRDLSGLAYIQASQKNYGLALKTITLYYGVVQEVLGPITDPVARKPFEELLATREKISAELAKGDAEVMNDLHPLFFKTQLATGVPPPPVN